MADPQVGVVELEGVGAVDRVGVVAHHRPLLEPGSFRALEGDATPVPIAQMVNLQPNGEVFTALPKGRNLSAADNADSL